MLQPLLTILPPPEAPMRHGACNLPITEPTGAVQCSLIQCDALEVVFPLLSDTERSKLDIHASFLLTTAEIGQKAGLFANLQPGRAKKRINAT